MDSPDCKKNTKKPETNQRHIYVAEKKVDRYLDQKYVKKGYFNEKISKVPRV